MLHEFAPTVLRHTRRLPLPTPTSAPAPGPGSASAADRWEQGAAAARQLDVALVSAGFKLSTALLAHLSELDAARVREVAAGLLPVVRESVGDHVRHNAYFVDFPHHVPDTLEFWAGLIGAALADETAATPWTGTGAVNLLELPGYGTYRHTYRELLDAHQELVAGAGDRLTVLELGGEPEAEVGALYLALAGSPTPLGEDGLRDLAALAAHCADGPQPERMPVRENRAVVNAARLRAGAPLLLDTVTDVLRLACALCDGDVGLGTPTRFGPLSRPVRRALLAGLDAVVAAAPGKLADVPAHREAFKRLGERLHPHEYPRWPHAAEVFAVARGERAVRTPDGRVEELLAAGDVSGAAALLAATPGRLLRALDRLLRTCRTDAERAAVLAAAERALPGAAGPLLLSVREHLHHRGAGGGARRVFVNRRAHAKVLADTRAPLPEAERERLIGLLDDEVASRLPSGPRRLLVDPDVLEIALPLSGRAAGTGFGVLPRGSLSPVRGELLRFFVYWKQRAETTDFDLSALMLDEEYDHPVWLSYTELKSLAGEHSGDVTEAPDGASEFINLRLDAVREAYIVPQVNVYSGEGFEQVEESFFGYMLRDAEQEGLPFEARTVRMKSELRGPGRIALPLVFERTPEGAWRARWLHLYLRGTPAANRVETNRVTVADLLAAATGQERVTVRHLLDLMVRRGATVTLLADGAPVPEGTTDYLGLERPDGLPAGVRVVTPENLRDLLPA
ncbi:hypothetical protein ACIQBJ_14460 [Kitasatospora sp. NPDC088391]|uniref:TerD family protein n=1 Tax=Kitasatospora sp. NPDC088391 TaxID=3364074 RepID=UPI00380DEB57